jgi:hypothetical protein
MDACPRCKDSDMTARRHALIAAEMPAYAKNKHPGNTTANCREHAKKFSVCCRRKIAEAIPNAWKQ